MEVSQAEELQCPITLESPPTVPVMTGCGHIFSLPAIVHCMLDAGGENFTCAASCPLCFTPVSARDLRLVSVRTVAPPPTAGEAVALVLLRRARDSSMPDAAAPRLATVHAATGGARAASASPLAARPFAKFVTVRDALPTMRAAATELAQYAAVIVAGGGQEAEVEGPSLFKSMGLLAGQARAWTLRRLQGRAAGPVVGAEAVDRSAVKEAADAELAVRDVFEIQMADERTRAARAAEAEEESRRKARRAEARNEVFPQLGGAGAASGARPLGRWGAAAGGSEGGSPARSPRGTSEADLAGQLQFDLDDGETPQGTPEATRPGAEVVGGPDGAGDAGGSPGVGSLEESMRLLGTSPSTGLSVNQVDQGDFYMYQASDGQWLFLHPINVRCRSCFACMCGRQPPPPPMLLECVCALRFVCMLRVLWSVGYPAAGASIGKLGILGAMCPGGVFRLSLHHLGVHHALSIAAWAPFRAVIRHASCTHARPSFVSMSLPKVCGALASFAQSPDACIRAGPCDAQPLQGLPCLPAHAPSKGGRSRDARADRGHPKGPAATLPRAHHGGVPPR